MDPHNEHALTHYITICPELSSINADGIVTKVQFRKNNYNCYDNNCLEVERQDYTVQGDDFLTLYQF